MMSRGAMWFLLLLLMSVMLSNACPSEPFPPANGTRWELLEAVVDQIHIEDGLMIRTKESYRYYFWDLYKSVPRSQRLEIVNKMSESLKEVAFRDRRLDMVGLILFGPDKGRPFLRIRHDKRPEPVNVLGYIQCVRTLDDLFEKHCGPSCFRGLRHTRSRANLCSLATKEAIEEAMILACGMNFIQPEPQQQVPYGYLAFGSGLHVLEVTAIFLVSYLITFFFAIYC
ncbi:putative legumain protein [Helianthus annuus]|nr:putative legumain protein [Helianthus annuus]